MKLVGTTAALGTKEFCATSNDKKHGPAHGEDGVGYKSESISKEVKSDKDDGSRSDVVMRARAARVSFIHARDLTRYLFLLRAMGGDKCVRPRICGAARQSQL